MRNLAEHPITNQEILDAMDTHVQRANDEGKDRIPNMDGVLMEIAFGIVKRGLRTHDSRVPWWKPGRRLEDKSNNTGDHGPA